jgi:type 1 glutamine amidotransferase
VCGESLNPMMVNWRRRAGCGRVFIDILGIHAETVKPAQRIFDELEARTGTAWQYFFVEDNGAA